MFSFRQAIFVYFLLFALGQITDGLTCYSCIGCDDSSKLQNVEKQTVPDNEGYSCAKYWSASQQVMRYPLISCTPNEVEGIGVFCCQKDLCNNANKMISINSLILSLGLTIIVMLFH